METLINGFLRIEPVDTKSFMASEKTTYEEVGVVVGRDEIRCSHIPMGSRVWFDSFMVKKYPTEELGKFLWFIHIDEIVQYAN